MTPLEQRLNALQKANTIRTANGKALKEIAALPLIDGIDKVITALRCEDPTATMEGAPIYRLLIAPRRLGQSKAKDLLKAAHVLNGDRKLRDLTRRQRLVIADRLENPTKLWPATQIVRLRRERDRSAEHHVGIAA